MGVEGGEGRESVEVEREAFRLSLLAWSTLSCLPASQTASLCS